MDATYKQERPLNPRSRANIFQIIFHSWILKTIKKGLEKDLNFIDLYNILDEDSAASLGEKIEKLWKDEIINTKNHNKKPSYLKVLFKMFGRKFIFYLVTMTIIEIILSISLATIVGKIVVHFDTIKSTESNNWDGICLAIGLITVSLIRSITFNSFDFMFSHMAMKMRVATCNVIYNKSLRLKTNSFEQSTSIGQIVNLMSNDVNRFDLSILYVPFLFIGPLQTVAITYFLWREVGMSSIFGIVALLIFMPLQMWLGSKTSEIRLKTAKLTDERVHLTNEIISGLRTIKMYTWESFFDNITKCARKKEINKIIQSSFVKGILSSFYLFQTRIALFVNLFIYVFLGNYLTASKVFVITSYYTSLRGTLALTPLGISLIAELLVSIKRIENFLLYEEKDRLQQSTNSKKSDECSYVKIITDITDPAFNAVYKNGTEKPNVFGIVVLDAFAKWTDSQIDNTLENINLSVNPGGLCTIIGAVGAGKSSLVQAILRELPLSEGNIFLRGAVSYASQDPWLFAGSIQQNILFGSPMDKERYKKVINVCALKTDFKHLPYGDRTVVGDKGVSLSGGQRSRINLARAVYKQADIYLLDDPLSAVDTHVGKHIFENCIKDFLKEKTRVLIIHQMQYLNNVDQIVLMDNAKILEVGTYEELKTSATGIDFMNLLKFSTETTAVLPDEQLQNQLISNNATKIIQRNVPYIRQESVLSVGSSIDEINTTTELDEADETHSTGSIAFNIYQSYFAAGGHCYKQLSLLVVCILTQVFASGGDYWINVWVNLEEHVFYPFGQTTTVPIDDDSTTINDSTFELIKLTVSRQTCIVVFAVLTLSVIVSAFVQSALLMSVCTTASMNLHNCMFGSITRATMHFLNTNPTGRILNRFSKDMGLIDEVLPSVIIDIIQIGLLTIGILIVVAIVNSTIILPTLVIVIVVFKIRKMFLKTSRNIKRLEAVARSPMFTHVNSSLQGLTTIRVFGMERILSEEFASHQDLHSSAWYLFVALSRAFGFWLDVICLLYSSIVIFCFILIGNETFGGNVGLAITQAIGLADVFQWGVRQSTELENIMTSVERVIEYTNVPQERALKSTTDKQPPKEWPNKGQIIFKQFFMRYESDTLFVLKNLNVVIESTEKVGIVGRTGAGKSSLIQAIFGLALNDGKLIIDGIEIHELGLHDLRSKISIIPQEPVLFPGTIRTNLDPFDEYPDHILWKVLDEVKLKDVVEDSSDGLNLKVSKGGSNLSVGQRQLVCLARVILRDNKIIVLDEATANVDPQTDALIQKTIKHKFQKCTVLTIAHRINTVIDADKILVLDAGVLVEFDHPYNLLKNKNGHFYKMVEQTGQINANLLHSVAVESYKNTKRQSMSF